MIMVVDGPGRKCYQLSKDGIIKSKKLYSLGICPEDRFGRDKDIGPVMESTFLNLPIHT